MSGVCPGIKRDGGRCTARVKPGETWCWSHDPRFAEQRRRNASRAGKGRPSREVADLKGRISEVVDGVLSGGVDKGRAAVAIQGLNALRAVLGLEREIREQEELMQRLAALEDAHKRGILGWSNDEVKDGGGFWRNT